MYNFKSPQQKMFDICIAKDKKELYKNATHSGLSENKSFNDLMSYTFKYYCKRYIFKR